MLRLKNGLLFPIPTCCRERAVLIVRSILVEVTFGRDFMLWQVYREVFEASSVINVWHTIDALFGDSKSQW